MAFYYIGKFEHVLNSITLWVVFYAYFIFSESNFISITKLHGGNYLKLEGDFLKAAVTTPAILMSKDQWEGLPSLLYLQDHSQDASLKKVESMPEMAILSFDLL